MAQSKQKMNKQAIDNEINRLKQKEKNKKNRELSKFFPNIVNLTSITAGGVIIPLSNVPQGVAQSQRIGDRIVPTKLEYRMSISAPDAFNLDRFIIFRWKNGLPIVSDILENGVGGIPGPYSMLKFTNLSNITLLHDLMISQVDYAVGSESGNFAESKTFKINSGPITFEPTTTAGRDKLWLLVISDSVAGPDPALSAAFYLWYHDDDL